MSQAAGATEGCDLEESEGAALSCWCGGSISQNYIWFKSEAVQFLAAC